MLLLIAVCVISFALYLTLTKKWNYWSETGVPHVESPPFVGVMLPLIRKQKSFAQIVQEIYNSFPNNRYVGFYNFLQPVLLIRDPEVIKQICVKDFDSFPEHDPFVSEKLDPLWTKNLFAVTAQRWKELRPTLSPAFTGSKMRLMFALIDEVAQQMVEHFSLQTDNAFDVELKESFTRFTNDVIATTAFGLNCNSFKEKENEFYTVGKNAVDFTGWNGFKIFLYKISPKFIEFLRLRLFDKYSVDFFSAIIKRNIRERSEKGIYRPDMLHLLLEARKAESDSVTAQDSEIGKVKKSPTKLSDDDIIAQALVFFLAGFETVSTAMCHTVYELALNPEVQDRLRREIDEVLCASDEKLTYECIARMKYLDMVISESLRKWPPALLLDRKCVKPYVIEPKRSGEKPVFLAPGSVVMLPMWPMHRDPQYFPDPEKFDPERFSDENRSTINPFTYYPFGAGPRNCIGSRFALLETKILIIRLMQSYEFTPTEKSQIPLRISPKKTVLLLPDHGFWLAFNTRR